MEDPNIPPVPPAPFVTPSAPITVPEVPPMNMPCPFCSANVPTNSIFCPACGKQLKEKELSMTLFKQVTLWVVALLLPPLGYWPGVKYFRSSDPKAQKLGMYLIVATTLSTIITLWLSYALVQSYIASINSVLNGTGITPSEATGGLF